jgi:hypothetical protein
MEIECTVANIFDQMGDVLVFASCPRLTFFKGLAKEISKRAGGMFENHCDDVKGKVPKKSGFYLFCPPFNLYQ